MAGGNLGTIWTEFRLKLSQLQTDFDSAIRLIRESGRDMERYISRVVRDIQDSTRGMADGFRESQIASDQASRIIAASLLNIVDDAARARAGVIAFGDGWSNIEGSANRAVASISNAIETMVQRTEADLAEMRQRLTNIFDDVTAEELIREFTRGGEAGEAAARTIAEAFGTTVSSLRSDAQNIRSALAGVFDDVQANQLIADLQQGGEAGREAARKIATAFLQIDDEIERTRRGLQVFGQAWNEVEREATQSINRMERELRDLRSEAIDLSEVLGGIGIGATGLAVGSFMDNATSAMGHLRAMLGLTGEEVKEFERIAREVYADGLGETMREAAEATAMVHQVLGLTGEVLREQTGDILRFSTVFETLGADTQITLDAMRAMTVAWGIETQEALNILTAGMQEGAGSAGDLLDTFQEYPPYLKAIGLTAYDMLNWLNEGMKAGAYNTDYLADALKEFGIRIMTEGDTAQEAIRRIFPDDEAERIISNFAEGGEAAREAFFLVMETLAGVEDAGERYNLAVELMGTKAEDLTLEVINPLIEAMAATKDQQMDLAGTTEVLTEEYSGLHAALERLKRFLGTSFLAPLGDLAPYIQAVIEGMAGLGMTLLGLSGLGLDISSVVSKIGQALEYLRLVVSSVAAVVASFGLVALDGLVVALGAIAAPAAIAVGAIAAVAGAAWLIYENWEGIREFFSNLFSGLDEEIESVFGGIITFFTLSLPEYFNNVVKWFANLPGLILEHIRRLAEDAPYEFGFFLGRMVAMAQQNVEDIIAWFEALPDRAVEFLQTLVKDGQEQIDELREVIVSGAERIVDDTDDTVPERFVEIFKSLIKEAVSWAKDMYDQAVQTAEDFVRGLIDGIRDLPNRVREIFSNILEAVRRWPSKLGEAVKQTAAAMWRGFRDGLDMHSPSNIERAMFAIADTAEYTVSRIARSFNLLGTMEAAPRTWRAQSEIERLGQTIQEVSQLEISPDVSGAMAEIAMLTDDIKELSNVTIRPELTKINDALSRIKTDIQELNEVIITPLVSPELDQSLVESGGLEDVDTSNLLNRWKQVRDSLGAMTRAAMAFAQDMLSGIPSGLTNLMSGVINALRTAEMEVVDEATRIGIRIGDAISSGINAIRVGPLKGTIDDIALASKDMTSSILSTLRGIEDMSLAPSLTPVFMNGGGSAQPTQGLSSTDVSRMISAIKQGFEEIRALGSTSSPSGQPSLAVIVLDDMDVRKLHRKLRTIGYTEEIRVGGE